VTGIQQSIKIRLVQLTKFAFIAKQKGMCVPTTFKIKLTGDGTRIARGYNIVNFVFMIGNEEGKAHSVLGNYTIAILKTSEHYNELTLETFVLKQETLKYLQLMATFTTFCSS